MCSAPMVKLLSLSKAELHHAPAPRVSLAAAIGERTYAFDSTSVVECLQMAFGATPELQRTLRPATTADLQSLLAKDVSTGSKNLVEWMRNPQDRKPVTAEELGARVSRLLGIAVRPEGFLRKAADALPAVRRPSLAVASVIGGLRSLGVDLRIPKTRATAAAIGAEVADFAETFEEATPMLFGQLNGGLRMNRFHGGDTPYAMLRDIFRDSMSAKGLAERNGLTLTRKQEKQLDGWVDRKARFLATETTTFFKNRDPMTYPETMSGFLDVLISDLVDSGVLPAEDKPRSGWRFGPE